MYCVFLQMCSDNKCVNVSGVLLSQMSLCLSFQWLPKTSCGQWLWLVDCPIAWQSSSHSLLPDPTPLAPPSVGMTMTNGSSSDQWHYCLFIDVLLRRRKDWKQTVWCHWWHRNWAEDITCSDINVLRTVLKKDGCQRGSAGWCWEILFL